MAHSLLEIYYSVDYWEFSRICYLRCLVIQYLVVPDTSDRQSETVAKGREDFRGEMGHFILAIPTLMLWFLS
jgi:hypothetical protein